MDQASEQKNNPQEQEKQSSGGISQGINTLNNLRGLGNPFRKGGSKAAVQAGKLAAQAAARGAMALFTTPVGWIILAVIVVAVITFAIVSSGGAPGAPPANTAPAVPTPTPTPPVEP